MAENEEKPAFPGISGNDLARFHVAHNVTSPKCWICGNGSWYVQSSDEDTASFLPWVKPDAEESDNRFLVLILSCTNCGTLWSMDYQAILKWLNENPA